MNWRRNVTLWLKKYTSLEDRVLNNMACLGEVEELAKAASELKLDTLASETESLNKEIDRLDSFSRRDNLQFFGLGPQTKAESFQVCVRKLVVPLTDVQNPIKQWTEEDISRAHRTGQSRTDGPRAMIVRFSRWKIKMAVLSDQTLRDGIPA